MNSFSDSAGFLKVGSDLLEMLRADGFDSINASLRGWLEEATRSGSGDDCTLGLICRMDALSRPEGAASNVAEVAEAAKAGEAQPTKMPEVVPEVTAESADALTPSKEVVAAGEGAQPQTTTDGGQTA